MLPVGQHDGKWCRRQEAHPSVRTTNGLRVVVGESDVALKGLAGIARIPAALGVGGEMARSVGLAPHDDNYRGAF